MHLLISFICETQGLTFTALQMISLIFRFQITEVDFDKIVVSCDQRSPRNYLILHKNSRKDSCLVNRLINFEKKVWKNVTIFLQGPTHLQ